MEEQLLENNKKADIADTFKLLKKFLFYGGCLPLRNHPLIYIIWVVLTCGSGYAFFAFTIVYVIVHPENVEKITLVFPLAVSLLSSSHKQLLLFINRRKFYQIMDHLDDPDFHPNSPNLNKFIGKRNAFMNWLQKSFLRFCIVGGFSIALWPLIRSDDLQHDLPEPFPFDLTDHWFLHKIVWIFQVFTVWVAALNSPNQNLLVAAFLSVGSVQYKILLERIEGVTDIIPIAQTKDDLHLYGVFDQKINQALKPLVVLHQKITKYVEMVEELLTYALLFQLSVSLISISIALFTMAILSKNGQPVFMGIYLMAVITELSILCFFGNELILESSKISQCCYSTKWNYCGPSVRKTLFIIMERSKRNVHMTAGKFVTLSLETYLAILKSSFSYFTIIRRLYSDNNNFA